MIDHVLPFENYYFYRRLVLQDGVAIQQELQDSDRDWSIVRLFRYVEQKFADDVRAWSYWSELETKVPRIAGEATGIGDNECVWRIEWSFPLSVAYDNLDIGERRFSQVGVFREYCNLRPIDQEHIVWHRMDEY